MNSRIEQRRQRLAAQRSAVLGAPPPLAVVPFRLTDAERAGLAARVKADAARRLAENEEDMVIAELVAAAEAAGEVVSDEEIFWLMDGEEDDTAGIRESAEISTTVETPEPTPEAPPAHWTDALPYTFFGRHV